MRRAAFGRKMGKTCGPRIHRIGSHVIPSESQIILAMSSPVSRTSKIRGSQISTSPTTLISSQNQKPGLENMSRIGIDLAGTEQVEAHIRAVRDAGLSDAAELFSTIYWGWLRVTEAYTYGHPYVSKPEPGMTPLSALHVADYSLNHWAAMIPGTPKLDDEAVLRDAGADEAWHRDEDRRIRRECGEPLAGTEHCDFSCPNRDSEDFCGSKAWHEKHGGR